MAERLGLRALGRGVRSRVAPARTRGGTGARRGVPQGRAARRQAARVRRARATLVASVVVSAVMLGLWFPAGALLHQRSTLAAATAQLDQLQREDRAMATEQKRLESPAEIARLAQDQYQLVNPGTRAFEVLPPTKGKSGSGSYAGDPANQPVVSPSAASELPAGSEATSANGSTESSDPSSARGAGTAGTGSATGHASTSSTRGGSKPEADPGSSSFFGRLARTLEFWR